MSNIWHLYVVVAAHSRLTRPLHCRELSAPRDAGVGPLGFMTSTPGSSQLQLYTGAARLQATTIDTSHHNILVSSGHGIIRAANGKHNGRIQ